MSLSLTEVCQAAAAERALERAAAREAKRQRRAIAEAEPVREYLLYVSTGDWAAEMHAAFNPEPLMVPWASVTDEHRKLWESLETEFSEEVSGELRAAMHSLPGGLKTFAVPAGSVVVCIWAEQGHFWSKYDT